MQKKAPIKIPYCLKERKTSNLFERFSTTVFTPTVLNSAVIFPTTSIKEYKTINSPYPAGPRLLLTIE